MGNDNRGSTGSIATETSVTNADDSVKVATPDLIIFDPNATSADAMADLIFENIGGEELLEISRSDLINSANVVFPRIKNVVRVVPPEAIDQMGGYSDTADDDTNNYPLSLASYVPLYLDPIEIDQDSGSILINTVNMTPELQIEVQFVANAKLFDDTIY
jgi:hypothetical protein